MSRKVLLLYANPTEVKYIHFPHMECIGMGGDKFTPLIQKQIASNFDFVILFGCSGALKKLPLNKFYTQMKNDEGKIQFGNDISNRGLHSKKETEYFRMIYYDALLVDMETRLIGQWCEETNILFLSIRYIIDYCDRKCKPIILNYFWRIFQHWRMQRKFNKILEAFYYE